MSAKNSLFSKQMKMKWILNASEIETVNIIIRKWLLLLHDTHCLEEKKRAVSMFMFKKNGMREASVFCGYTVCVCGYTGVSRAIQSSVGLIGVILAW